MKMRGRLCALFVLLACYVTQGHCLANVIDPPSGTTVAGFEGDVSGSNVFTCNVVFNDEQVTTTWSIRGLGGVEGLQTIFETGSLFVDLFLITGDERNDSTGLPTFRNRLTILNFTADIKDATLFCGTASTPEFANFSLRLYLPPSLRDNYMIKIIEGTQDVMVDLSLIPEAFPTPQTYQWTKDGNNVDSNTNPRITYTYPTAIFEEVIRADAGSYSLSASNYVPMNTSLAIGNDDGDFELDVLFGPEFDRGVMQRAVLLGDPLSLVCGKNLVSNPMATVEWRDPNEVLVANNSRYNLEDGPEVIRLNFTHTIEQDNGEWTCRVRVTATNVSVVQGGDLVVQPSTMIRTETVSIALTVVVPPSEPRFFNVDDVGATWAEVCWQVPESLGSPPVSRYEVVAMVNSTGVEVEPIVASTEGNETQLNVTGLLPGTVYVMSARAISEVETDDVTGRSGPSNTDSATTGVTVPAPNCTSVMSSSGDITVNWDYIHTGGLELTAVQVEYSFQDLVVTRTVSAGEAGVNDRSLVVPGLLTGRVYTFTVTASNSEGSASSECPPLTDHRIGVPQAPMSFTVTETGEEGGVSIVLVSNSAGVGAPPHSFNFDVSYGIPGRDPLVKEFPIQTYTSGESATVTIEGLDVGELYIFSARARNEFGSSDYTQGPTIPITGASPTPSTMTPTPSAGSSTGAIVGGVVGGLLVAIIIIILIVVIVVLYVKLFKDRGSYKPREKGGNYYGGETASGGGGVVVQEIDIGQELQPNNSDDHEKHELHYADLETFRPPSAQGPKTPTENPKPVETEEPVEYAIIDTFKKKPEKNDSNAAAVAPTPVGEGDEKAQTAATLV